MKYKLIIAFCLCLFFINAQVEKIKNDFKIINDNYLSLTKVSMAVTFKAFDNAIAAPLETETGYYKMQNGKVNSRSFNIEIVYDNSIYISVDDDSKRVITDSATGNSNTNLKSMPQRYLDTIFTLYKKVTMSKVSNEVNRYDFYFDAGEFSKVEVYVNMVTKFITKVSNYYSEPIEVSEGVYKEVRSEIEFTNINTNPTFTTEFNVDRFLNYSNGTYSLKPQYSTYSFINRYGQNSTN